MKFRQNCKRKKLNIKKTITICTKDLIEWCNLHQHRFAEKNPHFYQDIEATKKNKKLETKQKKKKH